MIHQTSALKFALLVGSFIVINNTPVVTKITPDNTLGAESSRVIPDGNIDRIDGGALRERNLFHSFSQFNVNNGQRVYFNNPTGVENILTRVTGGNASNILGTLGVDGNANLFLINPSGIVFGENARLDVRGSFVGTTASGLQFGEQGNFSATNPEAPPLLTVNPNALFFNQLQGNGGITNKSQSPQNIRRIPTSHPCQYIFYPSRIVEINTLTILYIKFFKTVKKIAIAQRTTINFIYISIRYNARRFCTQSIIRCDLGFGWCAAK